MQGIVRVGQCVIEQRCYLASGELFDGGVEQNGRAHVRESLRSLLQAELVAQRHGHYSAPFQAAGDMGHTPEYAQRALICLRYGALREYPDRTAWHFGEQA